VLALIGGQIGLHSTMAGMRMAIPLLVLRDGHSAWLVGVLIALFAAAGAIVALPAGRFADRLGYHRPLQLAVAVSMAGGAMALLSLFCAGGWQLTLLCGAAVGGGAGAHVGLIVVQRTAGHMAGNSTERLRIFSWLGLAPTMANVVGPVGAGLLIDHAGYGTAFGFLLLLPLVSLVLSRRVPREAVRPVLATAGAPHRTRDLWRVPGFGRALSVNWLVSSCWDVHGFAVPLLGHQRGFSASTIGVVLGMLPIGAAAVRLLIPLIASRLDEVWVLRGAMVWTALVFLAYPWLSVPWAMALCSAMVGLSVGSVQPMILSTLHRLTPHDRHGEAIALRSMTMNVSSSLMPLAFGVAGGALGVSMLFWLLGGAVGAGNWVAASLRGTAVRT